VSKILNIEEATNLAEQLRNQGKTIVLVGGCFDILHIGHIEFLKEARKRGDALFVLLESDVSIRKLKGRERPINPQAIRAEILASPENVDYVILLPSEFTNSDYDAIIQHIKPAVLATTEGDPNRIHKLRQAKLINAKVVNVIKRISDRSSTKLINLLIKEGI